MARLVTIEDNGALVQIRIEYQPKDHELKSQLKLVYFEFWHLLE